jgi:hypothetical protein
MKDPIVAEVRQHRMEHTKRFHGNLALICEDLRKLEAGLGERLEAPQPRLRRQPTDGPAVNR